MAGLSCWSKKMPDVKISALPAATTPLAGTEVLPIVQSSTTRKVSVADLTAGRAISASSVTNAGLTSGRVTFAGASGLLSDSANLTWNGTNLGVTGTLSATGNISVGGGAIPVASGYQYGIAVSTGGTIAVRAASNDYRIRIGTNFNLDGTHTNTTTNPVSLLTMDNGLMTFSIGASGTAGNAISYTSAMTLDTSGKLLVGKTSSVAGYRIEALGINVIDAETSTATGTCFQGTYSNTTGTVYFANWQYNGSSVGSITSTGTVTVYGTTSDYRLKENIVPMTGALATVSQLKPVTYKWKSDGSDGQGFIAHELQAVVPECVIGEKDAVDVNGKPKYQGIDTSFLVATLTKAIQEQQALIESLTTRLTALENK
jgi:hypothetical protein